MQAYGSQVSPPLPKPLLNQVELSRRWSLSPRTLEAWRWRGEGPAYLKIRGRILYRLQDVEAFEAASLVTVSGAPRTEGRAEARG